MTWPMYVTPRKCGPRVEYCNNGQCQVQWRNIWIPTQCTQNWTHRDRDGPRTEVSTNNSHNCKDSMAKYRVGVIRVNVKLKWNLNNKLSTYMSNGVKSESIWGTLMDINNQRSTWSTHTASTFNKVKPINWIISIELNWIVHNGVSELKQMGEISNHNVIRLI